ncbi:thioredoxin family protein [Gaetbulibacter aestuarii]|uniref:Thioredoxin family protein n=1 Tax=Gaetbulibacter aestuarii TaxID=1502358 RepID=A0ABW7MVW5_9FLAO
MNSTIKTSLDRSITYEEYRTLTHHLSMTNGTSGKEQSEAHIQFTKLNDRRMKRWDKTLKINKADAETFKRYEQKLIWLVLAESWCGDGAHMLPVLNKIAQINPNIELRIVLRDDNLELMDNFLTQGNRAIPKVIMIDKETGNVIGTYGPRPSEVTGYVNRFKAANGVLTASFKEDLQYWYNDDKGKTIIQDLIQILSRLQPSVSL